MYNNNTNTIIALALGTEMAWLGLEENGVVLVIPCYGIGSFRREDRALVSLGPIDLGVRGGILNL
jgi:hypothetical protein